MDRGENESNFSDQCICVSLLAVHLIVPDSIAYECRACEIGLVGVVDRHSVFVHDVSFCITNV